MAIEQGASPGISCVVPVYNGATYIEAAVRSLVEQSLPPFEIVVVDDGSTDDSGARAVAAGEGLVRLVRQANRGMDSARNAGRAATVGAFVHFLDADDLCPPGALADMQEALAANPGWDAVFGRWQNFWIAELEQERDKAGAQMIAEQRTLFLTAGLFRQRLFDRRGPFATDIGWQSATVWIVEAQRSGAVWGRVERLTLARRIHFSNGSREKSLDGMTDLVLNLHRATRRGRSG